MSNEEVTLTMDGEPEAANAMPSQVELIHRVFGHLLKRREWWSVCERDVVRMGVQLTGGGLRPDTIRDEFRRLRTLRGLPEVKPKALYDNPPERSTDLRDIVMALGGPAVLKRGRDPLPLDISRYEDLVTAVENGIVTYSFFALTSGNERSRPMIADLLGERLDELEIMDLHEDALSTEQGHILRRVATIKVKYRSHFQSGQDFFLWARMPNHFLGKRAPLDFMNSDEEMNGVLKMIEFGVRYAR